MSNKTLRILVADGQHFYRLKTERILNFLGYHRIAPMNSLEELLTVVEYGCEPLDLVIVNASITHGMQFDLLGFCLDNPQIRQALVYGMDRKRMSAFAGCRRDKVQVSDAALPDRELITHLMATIDPEDGQAGRAFPWRYSPPQLSWG